MREGMLKLKTAGATTVMGEYKSVRSGTLMKKDTQEYSWLTGKPFIILVILIPAD